MNRTYSERKHKILVHYKDVLEEMYTLRKTFREKLEKMKEHLMNPPNNVREMFRGTHFNSILRAIKNNDDIDNIAVLRDVYDMIDEEEYKASNKVCKDA